MLKGLVDFVDRINNQGITYFYNVYLSAEIWRTSLGLMGLNNAPTLWDNIIGWFATLPRDRLLKLAILQLWQGCIYETWKERNERFHLGITVQPRTFFFFFFEKPRCILAPIKGSRLAMSVRSSLRYRPGTLRSPDAGGAQMLNFIPSDHWNSNPGPYWGRRSIETIGCPHLVSLGQSLMLSYSQQQSHSVEDFRSEIGI